MTEFPNIARLGLNIWSLEVPLFQGAGASTFGFEHGSNFQRFIKASDLEQLLASAPTTEVYVWKYGGEAYWRTPNLGESDGTHEALLVGIQPIVRDTPESLLREFLERESKWEKGGGVLSQYSLDLCERAKRALGEK